jgi:tetratricopeptide (TPR) repeat protein
MSKRQFDLAHELNTGLAHHRAGRLDDAEAAYRKVLKRHPNHADALNLSGVIAQERGKPARAVQLISQALRRRRNFPEALTNLARAQTAAGDPSAAADNARRAIALAPDLVEAHIQLGRALLDLKDDDEGAAAACRRAVDLAPNSLDAQVNLGAALTRLKDYLGAAEAYQAAHILKPDRAETLTDFAAALTGLEHFDEALQCHERAVVLAPNDWRTHAGHAATLKQAQDVAGSVAACRRALALAPDHAIAWQLLAFNMAALGQFDEAIACHRHVLELDPDNAEAQRGLIAAGEHIENAAELARLRAAADDPTLLPGKRISLGFALGTLLDKEAMYDEAFERIATANRLVKEHRVADGRGFDRDALRRHVDALIAAFPPEVFASLQDVGDPSELPVFIVGMPRSGTTLTEQIVASHAQVFGGGERRDIGRIGELLEAEGVTKAPLSWDRKLLRQEAQAHIARLRALAGDAARVTDKMPDNIFWLGLIALLFPRGRVVLCRRDIRDVCLSCHFQSFNSGLGWSNDLEDCAIRAQEVERLVRHWRAVLPVRPFEMEYEALVADLEGQSRRLIDCLGLPWDPACLAFHETERQIMTASVWQVRQPLYASSVGRWRNYRRHLGPLLSGLAGIIPQDVDVPIIPVGPVGDGSGAGRQ